MNIEELALEIATRAHEGQFRNDGVTPYLTHPLKVAEIARQYYIDEYSNRAVMENENELEQIGAVAKLHDCLEDSPATEEDLRNDGRDQLNPEDLDSWEKVVDAVVLLTRNSDRTQQTYLKYLMGLKDNFLARIVKLADLEHNISTSDPGSNKHDKYLLAQFFLLN
jgi:(p)ppGpp synthase/HD superfamily hydrolase